METIAFILALPFLFLYFLPAMLASRWRKAHTAAIALVNLFLGWTFIGWVGALVWASADNVSRPQAATVAERKCPFCAETIKAAAIVCRFCNRDLPASQPLQP